ncbi:UBX domain-containing protein 4 [Toxocara canis]|uniref:UBX domain-containing protein 4 n=1 Tax=Toxocara canis TaxID=6265 RepID=A0A0B2VHI7_TOXCA|nr:UBX domain-containing protein 4 [Toxocara canis]
MKWFEGAVADAISESRKRKALFVVVILHQSEANNENTKKMANFWEEFDERCCEQQMVAIRVFDGSEQAKQFAQIYPVPIIPASYIIDLYGKPLDVITITETMDDVVFTSRLRAAVAAHNGGAEKQKDEPSSSKLTSAESGDRADAAALTVQNEQPAPGVSSLTVEEKAKRLVEMAREEKEARELAEQRRRDKLESQQQLKRLREQIKADREERQRREERSMGAANVCNIKPPGSNILVQQPIPSSECRIQCKFPDGSTLVHLFPSSSKFEELIELVKQDGRQQDDFYLVQMYPRREFPDTSLSFLELGLTPSATILVITKRSKRAVLPTGGSSVVGLIQYVLIAPFQVLYRLVLSFFGFGNANPSAPSTVRANNVGLQGDVDAPIREEQRFSRQEGNIRRFRNEEDSASRDPDDEARWNGNSTQQL